MADGITYRTEKSGRKKLGFAIGLLLGLILGWFAATYSSDDNNKTNTTKAPESSDTKSTKNSQAQGLVPLENQPSLNTRLTQYSQALVEAARENVDAPSDEAAASKASLDKITNDLLETLGVSESNALRSDFNSLNSEIIQYATTSRSGGDVVPVDNAFNQLVTDLKKEYKVTDAKKFDEKVASLKVTLADGIRNFANQDYNGSYTKQLQAEAELHDIFALLQKK